MRMRYSLLAVLSIATCATALAQSLRIVDGEGAPVSYANAYLPSAGTGAVADGGGRLSLNGDAVAGAPDSTSVTISAVGFRDTTLALGGLRRANTLTLAATSYALAESRIAAAAFTEARRAGLRVRHPPLTKCMVGFDQGEFGAAFEVDGECAVDVVSLDLSYGRRADRIVEVNVYALDSASGRPLSRLHDAPYRFTIPAEAEGRYALTLPEDDLAVVNGWVAVTTEILEADATLDLDTRCRGRLKGWTAEDNTAYNPVVPPRGRRSHKHLAVNRAADGTWTYHPVAPAIEVALKCVR